MRDGLFVRLNAYAKCGELCRARNLICEEAFGGINFCIVLIFGMLLVLNVLFFCFHVNCRSKCNNLFSWYKYAN